MIASLPMYDRPETRAANDRLWQAMRDALGYGPKGLTRNENPWDIWRAPDLLFAQTCSLPYRLALLDRVDIVATPVHALPCSSNRAPDQAHRLLTCYRQGAADCASHRATCNAFRDAALGKTDPGRSTEACPLAKRLRGPGGCPEPHHWRRRNAPNDIAANPLRGRNARHPFPRHL